MSAPFEALELLSGEIVHAERIELALVQLALGGVLAGGGVVGVPVVRWEEGDVKGDRRELLAPFTSVAWLRRQTETTVLTPEVGRG